MTESDSVSALLTSQFTYRWILLRMLEYCSQPRSYLAMQECVLGLLKYKVGIHTPDVLLMWLEESGGLSLIQIDGEGKWQTTPAGTSAMDHFSLGQPLRDLISRQPEYHQVYLDILKFCSQPRKRSEIEKLLAGDVTIQHSRLHPAYFISGLENHGGLEWTGGHWVTTQAAKGVFE
jgi:hypothetical protein